MATRRPRGFTRGPKRSTLWAGLSWGADTFTSVGGTILGSLSASGLALRPLTIVRQYVDIQVISDQGAAIERQLGAVGSCVVSDQASAIGVTAVPTPITDSDSDLFMMHQFFAGNESSITDRSVPATRMHFESKAMRKVNEDEDFLIIAEFDASGQGFILNLAFRFLIKLH